MKKRLINLKNKYSKIPDDWLFTPKEIYPYFTDYEGDPIIDKIIDDINDTICKMKIVNENFDIVHFDELNHICDYYTDYFPLEQLNESMDNFKHDLYENIKNNFLSFTKNNK